MEKQETHIDCLPTMPEPSPLLFKLRYRWGRRPVLVKGAASTWPAMDKWKNFDYLREVTKEKTVAVKYNAKGIFDYNASATTGKVDCLSLSFEDAVNKISKPGSTYYIAQANIDLDFPELLADIGKPAFVGSLDRVLRTNLWFGGAACKSPLHFDRTHNFLVQVLGTKRISLFPPESGEFLYPALEENLPHCSHVNAFEPDITNFPLYQQAIPFKLTAIIKPGDVLYVPPRWWHCVETLETAISLNYWFSTKSATPTPAKTAPVDKVVALAAFTITFKKADDSPDGPSIAMDNDGKIAANGKPVGTLSAQGALTLLNFRKEDVAHEEELLTISADGVVTISSDNVVTSAMKEVHGKDPITVGQDGNVSIEGETGITFGDDGQVKIKGDSTVVRFEGPSEAKRAAALALLALVL